MSVGLRRHLSSTLQSHTFLNSYSPVWAFEVHSRWSGSPKGSSGDQYSIMPLTSAEITVRYRALYCEEATKSSVDGRQIKRLGVGVGSPP